MVQTLLENKVQSIYETNVKDSNNYFKNKIIWRNVMVLSGFHITGFYGLYLLITSAKWQTVFFTYIYHIFCGLAGVHRLWTHRSYEAKWPLRVLLMLLHSAAFENNILGWCRDHRVHHKCTDTNADPHNSNRGFFFSHCGWLLVERHPEALEKLKSVDCSDIKKDPIVQFQKKHFRKLMILMLIIVPTSIPYYFWNETLWNSFFVLVCFRNILTWNISWLVNSAAHVWGMRPYDATINPRECFIAHLTKGEGFHNYHHVFPWDYRASEYASGINWTSYFIEFFARIGWAYDLKTVDQELIDKRKQRTGEKVE